MYEGNAARKLNYTERPDAKAMTAAEVVRFHAHSQLVLMARAAANGDKPAIWADEQNRMEWIVGLDAGAVDHHDLHAAIFNGWSYLGTLIRKQCGLDNSLRVMAGLEPIAAVSPGGSWNGTAGTGISVGYTAGTVGSSGNTLYNATCTLRPLLPPQREVYGDNTVTFPFAALHGNGVASVTFRLEGGTAETATEWTYNTDLSVWCYNVQVSGSAVSAYDGFAELEVKATPADAGQERVITGFDIATNNGKSLPHKRRFARASGGTAYAGTAGEGRDNVGLSLSGASYTYNGGSSEGNVESTGAFSSYTPSTDYTDVIALNDGSEWRVFKVKGKTDADNITVEVMEWPDGYDADSLWTTSETVSSSSGPLQNLSECARAIQTQGSNTDGNGMVVYVWGNFDPTHDGTGGASLADAETRFATVTVYPGGEAADAVAASTANTDTWHRRYLCHFYNITQSVDFRSSTYASNMLWVDSCIQSGMSANINGSATQWPAGCWITNCTGSNHSAIIVTGNSNGQYRTVVVNHTVETADNDIYAGVQCVWKSTLSDLVLTPPNHMDIWQQRDTATDNNVIVFGIVAVDRMSSSQPLFSSDTRSAISHNALHIAGNVIRSTSYPQQSQFQTATDGMLLAHNTHLGVPINIDMSADGTAYDFSDSRDVYWAFNVIHWVGIDNTNTEGDGSSDWDTALDSSTGLMNASTLGAGREMRVRYNHFVNQWPDYTGNGDGTQNEVGERIDTNAPADMDGSWGNTVSAANNQEGEDVITSPTGTTVASYLPVSGISLVPSGDALIGYDVAADSGAAALANDGTDEIGGLQTVADPPTVSSLSPSSVARSQSGVDITITGTDFVDGADATASGSGITVNSTTFVSDSELTWNIDLAADATFGYRDVTVTNPDAQEDTLSNGLRVLGAGGLPGTDAFPATGSMMMQRVLPRWDRRKRRR